MKKQRIKIVKEIKDKGFPTNYKKYSKCHKVGNKKEKLEMGKVHVQKHKKGTLLGSYNRDCSLIFISEEVEPKKRINVKIHEIEECKCMKD